jgi:hypothetical protein
MIDLNEFERRLRQPSPSRKEDDPMVELARLAGGEDDPYKNVFQAQAETPPQTTGPREKQSDNLTNRLQDPLWDEQLGRAFGGDFSAIEAGLRNSMPPPTHGTSGAEPDHYGNYVDHTGGEETWGEEAEEDYSDEVQEDFAAKRSRKPLYIVAAIVTLGILGIGATFALKTPQSGPHEVALIKADSNPNKIQPQPLSEADAPSQEASILQKNSGQTGQTGAMALANNVEQPVDLAQAQEKSPRVIALSGNKTDNNAPVSGAANVPVPAPPETGQAQPLTIAALIEPKKVKTISVRPDGTLLPNDIPPQIPPSVAPTPVPRPNIGASATKPGATPKAPARVVTTPQPADGGAQPIQPGAKPVTNAGESKPTQMANSQAGNGGALPEEKSSGFSIQLAAPPTEQEARTVQIKLMKQFSDILSGQHTSIRRAGSTDKPIYRVRVGSNLSREEATNLCLKVQGKGGNCFVAKN